MTIETFFETFAEKALQIGMKILIALVIMFVSFKIINWVGRKITIAGENKNTDKTVLKTLVYALKLAAKCVVAVCLVGYLGIDTSGATALITSLGVGIGLAVNGALSNMAGGVLILLTRPFKVDDFIEAQSVSGTVTDIRITHTKVVTPDNKVVYIPNGELSAGNVINYSEKDTRRVDMEFSIAYSADFDKARSIITDLLTNNELVLKEKEPFVRIASHGASGLLLKVRVWSKSSDYWTVYYDTMEAVKKAFDENGIEIPFNQLDVHIKNQ